MKEIFIGQTFELKGRPGPESKLTIERDIERIRLATRPEVLAVLRDCSLSKPERAIVEKLNERAVEQERAVKLAYERAAKESDPPLAMARALINLQIAQACLGIEVEPSEWSAGNTWRIVNTNIEVVPAITRELAGMHKEIADRAESTRSDAMRDLSGTLANKYSGVPEEDFMQFPSIAEYATGLDGLVNNCN